MQHSTVININIMQPMLWADSLIFCLCSFAFSLVHFTFICSFSLLLRICNLNNSNTEYIFYITFTFKFIHVRLRHTQSFYVVNDVIACCYNYPESNRIRGAQYIQLCVNPPFGHQIIAMNRDQVILQHASHLKFLRSINHFDAKPSCLIWPFCVIDRMG